VTAPDPTPQPDLPPLPPLGPDVAPRWPATAEATAITVPGLDCGHLPGEMHDGACAYWASIARGDGVYELPDCFGSVVVLPVHAPGLVPLRDRALGGAA
jgi:hypothetical protein